MPKNVDIALLNDQSVFVKAAIDGVVSRPASAVALLTSLMILLFLGSWRSTLIIATSILLAILGRDRPAGGVRRASLNTRTWGGLALAVGILVDDADGSDDREHQLPS